MEGMRILTDAPGMERALKSVEKILRSCGPVQERHWSFPDGSSAYFPTWLWTGGNLAVGFSTEHLMKSGRPIVLSLEKPTSTYSPNVEVNIPLEANTAVQGCFAIDKDGVAWLCHRGSRLTVQAFHRKRLKKWMIHDYFRKWLYTAVECNGANRETVCRVIRVTPLSKPPFHQNLERFASSVKKLKNAWITYEGSDEKMSEFISRNYARLGSWK
ncbi:hypothetical protein HPC49_33020 [Pyxidicoccus fallax]|uniref:Uncharacterized protein n=1 Tax=Pyxidicoccus fallax TaxID=394095 RepID=A0A848LW15_9BACT|nr:hypothetical protein [Pyxidicoccus fallax]NMO21474.1 hypothetical protein [Pyxidicoccus fallax]NPC83032.1 hypothetical protein [Pyxidicoccus fallax]